MFGVSNVLDPILGVQQNITDLDPIFGNAFHSIDRGEETPGRLFGGRQTRR